MNTIMKAEMASERIRSRSQTPKAGRGRGRELVSIVGCESDVGLLPDSVLGVSGIRFFYCIQIAPQATEVCARPGGVGRSLNVPTGTFWNGEIFRCKLLIPRAGSWANEWNQGIRLLKKCLLSRTSNAYESRLDTVATYFIRYGFWTARRR